MALYLFKPRSGLVKNVACLSVFQNKKGDYKHTSPQQVTENVYEHKTEADNSSLPDKNKTSKSKKRVPLKIRTLGIDKLVENLIQQSMSKGEFNNLKNFGKPLPTDENTNPYVDFITHKVNEILIDNGFQPEWITLQKEIRKEANRLRTDLLMERKYFGPYPLSVEENIKWKDKVYQYKNIVEKINKKIEKFNLVVPVLNKQMLQISLDNEARNVMVNRESTEEIGLKKEKKHEIQDTGTNLFGVIKHFFKWN